MGKYINSRTLILFCLSHLAVFMSTVSGQCRDEVSWCSEHAHRCDESTFDHPYFHTACPFTTTTTTSTTTARTVTDVDECADRVQHRIDRRCHECTNTDGGYTCECNTGYQLEPTTGRYCVDIDECNNREETGVPASCHICDNLPGSYQCRCDIGYEPSNDRKSCVACSLGLYGVNCSRNCHCHNGAACLALDGRCPHGRCSPGWRGFPYCNYRDCALNNGGCQQRCESGKERHLCSCWEGYTLLDDGTTCAADDSACLRDANGLEYNGTLSMSSTGETCQPWDSAVYPEYRHNFCRNQAASALNQPWCFSALGYPVTCSIPICSELDQCADDNGGCQQECSSSAQQPHHCNRFPGYQGVDALSRNCTDIDECSEGSHSCTNGECCVNTDGGYYCECASGYYIDMDTFQCTASATVSSSGACGHQYDINSMAPAGSSRESTSPGAAIGGGLGGLAFLVLLAVVLIMVYRKRRSQSTQSGTDGEQVVDYMNVVNDQATDGKCECPMLHDKMEDGVYDEIAEQEPTRRTMLGTEPREGMYTVPPISASPPVPTCYDALLHAPIADALPVQTSIV